MILEGVEMLTTERKDAVLLITLDRPAKRNALHPDLISRLAGVLEGAEADHGVRVVVITGAGTSFCAGLDLEHLTGLGVEGRVRYMASAFALFRQLYELRQPVIAAVNGPAMAGGFDLAAFSDIRLCATGAKFAQTEILLGLTQIIYPIHHVIGLGRAKELAMTGRVVRADEAYRIGLVSAVHTESDLLSEALELARSLAEMPAGALFDAKRLSRELVDLDTDAAMTRMFDVICARLRSAEHHAALARYAAQLGDRPR
jgi:enoyl-CoA hydratase/carnithine racemase